MNYFFLGQRFSTFGHGWVRAGSLEASTNRQQWLHDYGSMYHPTTYYNDHSGMEAPESMAAFQRKNPHVISVDEKVRVESSGENQKDWKLYRTQMPEHIIEKRYRQIDRFVNQCESDTSESDLS